MKLFITKATAIGIGLGLVLGFILGQWHEQRHTIAAQKHSIELHKRCDSVTARLHIFETDFAVKDRFARYILKLPPIGGTYEHSNTGDYGCEKIDSGSSPKDTAGQD